MSFGDELLNETAYEDDMEAIFSETVEIIRDNLSKKSDNEILDIVIKYREGLNKVTEHFPAYDVAVKIKNNSWTPTPKQRQAIINTVAFYKAKDKFTK
jgi:hypothetical protein